MVDADTVTLDPVDRVREADHPHSPVLRFGPDKPLRLDAGIDLSPFQIAYQT
jgi:homoserine O-acetyltransferase